MNGVVFKAVWTVLMEERAQVMRSEPSETKFTTEKDKKCSTAARRIDEDHEPGGQGTYSSTCLGHLIKASKFAVNGYTIAFILSVVSSKLLSLHNGL